MRRFCLLAAAAALTLTPLIPTSADAQRRPTVRRSPAPREVHVTRVSRQWRDMAPRRQMTLAVGVLDYYGTDSKAPMAALRADWRLARWLRSELSVAYALAEVVIPSGTISEEVNSNLLHASLGLNAELPVPFVRPYVGAAVGLFGRFDEDEGQDFVRPSVAVPVGVRLAFSPRMALRGEARFRFDEQLDGRSAISREYTLGLSFGY